MGSPHPRHLARPLAAGSMVCATVQVYMYQPPSGQKKEGGVLTPKLTLPSWRTMDPLP